MNPELENLQKILDSISEHSSKIKSRAGRPKKYVFEKHDWLPKMLGTATRCNRSKQNYINAQRVYDIILTDPKLSEGVKGFILNYLKSKRTVAAELGRFTDSRMVISVASKICVDKMTTEKAVGLCRRMRGKGSHDFIKLSRAIERTIKRYRERYQTVSAADIASALRMVIYE